MDALTVSAASGIKARIEALEMLANNIANQASPGYKADREFYSLYIAPEALDAAGAQAVPLPPTVPVIERHWTDFSQGSLTETGNPLHVALSGRGFFTVQGSSSVLYTRAGNFRLSPAGRIETQDALAVLDDQSRPITVDPARPVEITATGEIRQDANTVARLGLVDFEQPNQLEKHAGTYFQLSAPDAVRRAPEATLYQGRIESANQAPAEAAVRLISVLRQFETLQKAIQIGSEMGRRSDEVARVSG